MRISGSSQGILRMKHTMNEYGQCPRNLKRRRVIYDEDDECGMPVSESRESSSENENDTDIASGPINTFRCCICHTWTHHDNFSYIQRRKAKNGDDAFCLKHKYVHHSHLMKKALNGELSFSSSEASCDEGDSDSDASTSSESRYDDSFVTYSEEEEEEEDENCIITFGKHRGNTYRYVYENDKGYCSYVIMRAHMNESYSCEGFQLFFNWLIK